MFATVRLLLLSLILGPTLCLGTPQRITDKTSNIVCAAEHDAFGNATSALMDMAMCGQVNWGDNAEDCLVDRLISMLPSPDPCAKFGQLFSAVAGIFGNSLTPETEVHVRPKGASPQDAQWGKTERRAIKDLRPGDEVLALAEWKEPGNAKNSEGKRLDQRLSYEKVVDIVTSHREQTLVLLTLTGGKIITATEGHPFKTTEGWRDAILLRKGGQLLLKGNGDEPPDAAAGSAPAERIATIADIRIEKRTVPVFNLEVANAHTFFVGDDGALVHNRGGYEVACGSKRAAFRQAKRDSGIPMGQHPKHPTRNEYGGRDYDFGGGKGIQGHPNGRPYQASNGSDKPHFNTHGEGQDPNAHYTYSAC